jgi:general secretion pathway protein H
MIWLSEDRNRGTGNRNQKAGSSVPIPDSRYLFPGFGFTLLELLIVLAIAAASFAMIGPQVSSGLATMKLNTAANDMASALRFSRSRAISNIREAEFFLDVERHRYRVTGRQKEYRVPESIHLKLLTAESEILGEGQGIIRFFPDGSSTGGRITLEAGQRTRLVDVNWLTGQVIIRTEQ